MCSHGRLLLTWKYLARVSADCEWSWCLQSLCVLMVTQNVIELLVGLKALPKYAKVRRNSIIVDVRDDASRSFMLPPLHLTAVWVCVCWQLLL